MGQGFSFVIVCQGHAVMVASVKRAQSGELLGRQWAEGRLGTKEYSPGVSWVSVSWGAAGSE